MKTKVLPEFKNWDKMNLNGQNVASGGLRVERPRLKF